MCDLSLSDKVRLCRKFTRFPTPLFSFPLGLNILIGCHFQFEFIVVVNGFRKQIIYSPLTFNFVVIFIQIRLLYMSYSIFAAKALSDDINKCQEF